MAFAAPGVGEEKERASVSSTVFRGLIAEIVGLDFRVFMEGTVGNLFGISRGTFLMAMFAGFLGVLAHQIPDLPLFVFAWLVGTMPVWILPAAVVGGWKTWVWYVNSLYLSTRKGILLEVKMPRELEKSPHGMDVAFAQWWIDSGVTTFFHRKWLGQVLPIFSLEIASFGGQVHFYVWCWENWRPVIESSIYAQYPEVEIEEVEDYASKFVYDPPKTEVYCTDYRYEPKNDAYPIKTYIEFELDKDPEEEHKVDPLAQVVERMSALGPTEQIWLQIVITMDQIQRRNPHGKWWETENRYRGLAEEEVDNIRKIIVGNPDSPSEKWKSYSRVQMYRVNEQIKAIERNAGKRAYNVGLRGVFISPPEKFGPEGWNNMRWIWAPMGDPGHFNQLRPRRWHTPFDYPYQDFWDLRWHVHAQRFFDCYRRRAHFYPPHVLPSNTMSTEVLATLWHPLSSGIQSPGIERIHAKKAEPPHDLPV